MVRPGPLVVASVLFGCGSSTVGSGLDASFDVEDATVDASRLDAGATADAATHLDTDAAVDDREVGPVGTDACPSDAIGRFCNYQGYGSRCPIPCSVPSDCRFGVRIRWSFGCCRGPRRSDWEGCRCFDGLVECRIGSDFGVPFAACDFCNEPDGG